MKRLLCALVCISILIGSLTAPSEGSTPWYSPSGQKTETAKEAVPV